MLIYAFNQWGVGARAQVNGDVLNRAKKSGKVSAEFLYAPAHSERVESDCHSLTRDEARSRRTIDH